MPTPAEWENLLAGNGHDSWLLQVTLTRWVRAALVVDIIKIGGNSSITLSTGEIIASTMGASAVVEGYNSMAYKTALATGSLRPS